MEREIDRKIEREREKEKEKGNLHVATKEGEGKGAIPVYFLRFTKMYEIWKNNALY